jgi:hypothetical protein
MVPVAITLLSLLVALKSVDDAPRRRSLPGLTVPAGIHAPPGRSFSIELVPVAGVVESARVSLSLSTPIELSVTRARSVVTDGARFDPEARRVFHEVFEEFRPSRIECREWRVTATVPLEYLLGADDYTRLLSQLARAARHLEFPFELTVLLGGRRAPARCSYCHGELTGNEPDFHACGACGTVLHEGCWAELGRCPVFGCRGLAERERSRA